MKGSSNAPTAIGGSESGEETEPGSEPRSAFRSPEKPGSPPKQFRRAARQLCVRQQAGNFAVIAAAYGCLRSEGTTRLHLQFAAKIAAASLTGRPEEIQAAVNALTRERDAALQAFTAEMHAAERGHKDRVREMGPKRMRYSARPVALNPARRFRRAAKLVPEKAGRKPRRPRRVRARFIVSMLTRRFAVPALE